MSRLPTLDLSADGKAAPAAAVGELEYRAENDEGGYTWYTKKELTDAGYTEEDLKGMKTRKAVGDGIDGDDDTEIEEAPPAVAKSTGSRSGSVAKGRAASGARAASASGAAAAVDGGDAGAGGEVSWLFMHDIRKVKAGGKAGKPNYDDLTAWTKYDDATAKTIEAAYGKYTEYEKKVKEAGKGKVPRAVCQVAIKVVKTDYVVCFKDDDGNMRQWRKDDTDAQRPVQRRADATAARPAKSPKKDTKKATIERTKSAPKPKSEVAAAAAPAASPKKSGSKRGASGEVKAPAAAAAAAAAAPAAEADAPPAKRKRAGKAEEVAAPKESPKKSAAAAKESPKKSAAAAAAKETPKKSAQEWFFMHDIRYVKDASGDGKTTHGKPNYNKKDAWTKYSDEIAAKLEPAYQAFLKEAKPLKKHTQVGISSGGKDYIVTFKDKDGQMRQWRKDDEYLTRPVQRREKGKRWGA